MTVADILLSTLTETSAIGATGMPLPDLVVEHLQSHRETLSVASEATGYEAELTGSDLPAWIEPLHFEKNLNAALDALESVERLLSEYEQITLIHIHNNFAAGSLSNVEDDSWLAIHEELITSLDPEGRRDNILFRLSKKVTDLVEYSKAAKLGARLLFGIQSAAVHDSSKYGGVTRLRESLRSLVEEYRQVAADEQEVTVAVSLKSSKGDNGEYLVKKFAAKPAARGMKDRMAQRSIAFDLANYEALAKLEYQRIRRIGLQIFDYHSGWSPARPANKASYNHHYPHAWQVTLRDRSEGFPLGTSAAAKRLSLAPIRFLNVAGARNTGAISWTNYPALINMPANHEWGLEVAATSITGRPFTDIADIIVHFHVAYQAA